MKKKNIHAGHRKRMREKFLNGYADSFCDHELLEILLFYCIPVANTNHTAHELIESFGGISGVFKANADELVKINGISSKTAEKIVYIGNLMEEYRKISEKNREFHNFDSIEKYFLDYFKDIKSDICLVINAQPEFETLDKITIPVSFFRENKISEEETAKMLIMKNMHNIVIGINHGDRSVIPGSTDYSIMQFFFEKFRIFDVTVEDCIICSGTSTFSLMRNGAFDNMSV
ncbi:MAG: hypothetical protein IJ666_01450 [Ruminococcus sp.]|nr:hypothetical protein [Ruminococcus sp.]